MMRSTEITLRFTHFSVQLFLMKHKYLVARLLSNQVFQNEIIVQERQAEVPSVALHNNSADTEQYITIMCETLCQIQHGIFKTACN